MSHNAVLNLFLEVELGPDLHPIQPPEKTKEDIMIFLKLYDPIKEELWLFVKSSGCASEILTKLNGMAGFSSGQEIKLYEEIKFTPSVMCEPIHKELTFQESQLQDGDIVCFQKHPPVDSGHQCRYPDVPSFLEHVHNCQVVHFRSLKKPKEDEFCLELPKLSTCGVIVKRVARQLGIDDPLRIRLTPHKRVLHERSSCLSPIS